MIDRTQIVYEALTGASTLQAQISTRAFSPVAPDSWDGSQKAVIFHQDSSSSHITGSTNTASFVFKCYGGDNTYSSARTIFRLLYDRLQMARLDLASGVIISARLETDTQLPPEADTRHKAHLARFSIQFEG